MAMNVLDGSRRPVGYQHIADVSAATGLTVPTNARVALIQGHTASVRWRDDGTDPTAAITGGMLLTADDMGFLYIGQLEAIKFIEAAAGVTGGVNVAYYA